MGMNFPNTPAVGTLYPAVVTAGMPQYIWDGSAWKAVLMPYQDAPSDGLPYARKNAAWDAPATAAQFLNNTPNKLLVTDKVWAAAAYVGYGVLTTTLTPDFGAGIDFYTANVLTGTMTMAAPLNIKAGQKGLFYLQQDATGSRTVSWNSIYKFANGGTKPVLSTAGGAVDIVSYHALSSTFIACALVGLNVQ